MSEHEWQALSARITAAAAEIGLDLAQPFGVAHYNRAAPATERLPDFGRPNALGILFGNTRRLWPAFTRAYAHDPELARSAHPLDSYVVTRLGSLLRAATRVPLHTVFAHVTSPTPFPIQRLAEAIGFAALSPSHLVIHAEHGPWLGLRAVVVLDSAGPATAPPAPARPCSGCAAPCLPALERAVTASGSPVTSASIARHAGAWIAVRDACPVGTASRYGAAQLAYHYAPTPSGIVADP